MGRKKSLEKQIAGKSLAEVKKQIRAFEKSLIDEAVREIGTQVLDAYLSHPGDPFFIKKPCLQKGLEDLSLIKKPRPKKTDTTQQAESTKKPNLHRKPQSNYEPINFVADISDDDL